MIYKLQQITEGSRRGAGMADTTDTHEAKPDDAASAAARDAAAVLGDGGRRPAVGPDLIVGGAAVTSTPHLPLTDQ